MQKITPQEYKTKNDLVEKVKHWELGKISKFDHKNKLYKQNPEIVRENETHKLFWDLETQKGHLISIRRPDLAIINKKKKRKN